MQSSNELSRVEICALSVMRTGSCCVNEKLSCGANFASRCYNDFGCFVVACPHSDMQAAIESVHFGRAFSFYAQSHTEEICH